MFSFHALGIEHLMKRLRNRLYMIFIPLDIIRYTESTDCKTFHIRIRVTIRGNILGNIRGNILNRRLNKIRDSILV
jgi:hypothetical protein